MFPNPDGFRYLFGFSKMKSRITVDSEDTCHQKTPPLILSIKSKMFRTGRSRRTQISIQCSRKPPTSPSTGSKGILLDALYDHCPLRIQLIRIPIMALLLTVLQPTAFVILQHSMLPTVVPITETAVPNYALRSFFAIFMGTSDLLRRHATTYR